MGPFLTGFADELVKLGAFGAQHTEADPYNASEPVAQAMNKYYGTEAKTGLKSPPLQVAPASRNPAAPSPLTTPRPMTNTVSTPEGKTE